MANQDLLPPTEEEIISIAFEPAQRAAFRRRLAGVKTRGSTLDRLNHRAPIDARFATWFKCLADAAAAVAVPRSTPTRILSADGAIDGACLPLSEAIDAATASGWGTIIGVTRSIALYCDERGTNLAAVIRKP